MTRRLDPSVASNRFILVVTPLAGGIAGLVSLVAGDGFGHAVRMGISAGGVTFLAWAIGRELDPDHPLSAGVASIAAPWLLLIGVPDLLGSALILLVVRLAAGTTGHHPSWSDAAVLATGAALVASRPAGPAFVAAAVASLVVVAGYEPGARKRVAAAGVAMAVAGTVVAVWAGRAPVTDPVGGAAAVVLVCGAVAAALSVALVREVKTPTDRGDSRVFRSRVRWARGVAAVAVVAAWLWAGSGGVAAGAAIWAALAATLATGVRRPA